MSDDRTGLTRRDFMRIAAGATGAAAVSGVALARLAEAQRPPLAAPTITCVQTTGATIDLQICAGAHGAPAGFSIQWVKHDDFPLLTCNSNGQENLWPASNDPILCKGSFSGVPSCSIYNLGPNQCVTVEIGNLNDADCGVGLNDCGAEELDCGTEYVFRAFAHNVPGPGGRGRSAFTANRCCSTVECQEDGGCVRTQGYWKTHGPDGCRTGNNANEWPQDVLDNGLTIGGTNYTAAQLCENLQLSGQGNAVRILSHQLIAALLNMESGATAPSCNVAAASALLNGLDINTSVVATNTTLGQQMIAAKDCLDLYNNGGDGVSHCP